MPISGPSWPIFAQWKNKLCVCVWSHIHSFTYTHAPTNTHAHRYHEVVAVVHDMDLHSPQYLRVKEIFESVEAFQVITSFLLTAQNQGRKVCVCVWECVGGRVACVCGRVCVL